MEQGVRTFQDLVVWQHAHELALCIYKKTQLLPDTERFGLISQIRRASVSVPSNIAEGFGREGIQETIRFYRIAKASLAETLSQLLLARDLGFLSSENFNTLHEKIVTIDRLLAGIIRSTRNRA